MDAIIYESCTGFTKKYAQLLSEETGLKAYTIKEAGKTISKGSKVIFMGWLKAGNLQGYKKICRKYNISIACAVGMGIPNEKTVKEVIERHHIPVSTKVFVLQGGLKLEALTGINKFMMNIVVQNMLPQLEKKENKTPEEIAAIEMVKNGHDYVSVENLKPVIELING
ncbi:MAG: hypothetical protein ACI4DS_02730 [Eubacterium sp.]